METNQAKTLLPPGLAFHPDKKGAILAKMQANGIPAAGF